MRDFVAKLVQEEHESVPVENLFLKCTKFLFAICVAQISRVTSSLRPGISVIRVYHVISIIM